MRKNLSLVMLILLAISLAALVPLSGCATSAGSKAPTATSVQDQPQYVPVFTDPAKKIAETSGQTFTAELYAQALAYEPLLGKAGSQVSMGYWSAKGNHGSLVRVLDAINEGPATTPPQKAIWDEGATSSNQYPAYDTMLEEHWYERDNPTGGQVTIFGKKYTDPHPVTVAQADQIWGQYSQRYADMAKKIRQATGKPVRVLCFVQGAKANRIFFTYEFPELKTLEQSGDVQVFFAKTQDADPNNPADWTQGSASAPAPVPAQ